MQLTIEKLLKLYIYSAKNDVIEMDLHAIRIFLLNSGLKHVGDLREDDGGWKNVKTLATQVRITR